MAKINIQIEINEDELETLMGGEECDCCNEYGGYSDNNPPEKTYTKQEMLDANLDELNWYKNFYDKHYLEFLRGSMTGAALEELRNRIAIGEEIVSGLKDCEDECEDNPDLINCIKDELDWDASFCQKYYNRMSDEARTELCNRILEAKRQYKEYTGQ